MSDRRTFLSPHARKLNPKTSTYEVDKENSEEFYCLSAFGNRTVVYGLEQNRYWSDLGCTKELSDDELQKLDLPLPIEIETARRKLIKQANDAGTLADMRAIRRATAPQRLDYPEHIKARLINRTPEDKIIEKLNRAGSRA